MKSLKGKRCFITGAASGIGRATASLVASRGAHLFLADRNGPLLDAAVAEIVSAGGTVEAHVTLDLSNFDAVRSFADDLHARFGSMDVVMNIAGISVWGTVEKLEHRHWRNVVDVNLMGPIHVIECFVPEMIRAKRGGHIVNVSSAAGLFGLPWHAAYSASKFGLRGVSEVLRFDLERHGIGVSLVCPGGVDTPLVDTVEVVGVDAGRPAFRKLKAHFRSRAVTPEVAASAIVHGVLRGEYLVFTSPDIRFGYWLQNKVPFLYERYMRRLNARMGRTAELAETEGRSEPGGYVRGPTAG